MASRRAALPLLLLALAALVAGVWGGLLRMAWPLPLPVDHANWITWHGPLMVAGFFGTLIGLERAAALGRPWAWLAPLLTGLGAGLVGAGALGPEGPALVVAGSAVLALATAALARRQPGLPMATLLLGAAAWVAGNAFWLAGREVARLVVAWGAFFLLTITGERLELARLRPPSRASALLFHAAVALVVVAVPAAAWAPAAGERLFAAGALLFAVWLLRFDVARTTVRSPGLPRYIAVALLSAYAWLALAAVMVAAEAPLSAGRLGYDAAVHALFLGFVFSMVFGHAPVVSAALLGGPPPYSRILYGPLALLDASLLLRVGADHAGWHAGRRWGGLLGAAALALFLAALAGLLVRRRRRVPV